MKKSLLLSAALLAAGTTVANAATNYYSAPASGDVIGFVNGVSDNGKFAAITNEDDNVAYIWYAENPTEFKLISRKATINDIADNGLAVGSRYQGGQYRAYIYTTDGEWVALEEHPGIMNEQQARCITPDAKRIAGYEFCKAADSEQGGRYYPVVWDLDEETGEYTVIPFNDLELPPHQGFITQCMTPDGKYLAGRLYCGLGSMIPAIIDIEKHEYFIWNELETRLEPWYYKGQQMGLAEVFYIDGYKDERSDTNFTGELVTCDANGNFYGYRTVAHDVKEDGSGEIKGYASIYNINNNEWLDIENVSAFSIGFNNAKSVFASNARMVNFNEDNSFNVESIFEALDFKTSDDISAVTHGSADGKVLGGIYGVFNPGTGEPIYYPFMIVLDEPLTGISDIAIDHESGISIIVGQGRIEVAGAGNVAVYNLNGQLVSNSASSSLNAGIYVVKADKVSRKVVVK